MAFSPCGSCGSRTTSSCRTTCASGRGFRATCSDGSFLVSFLRVATSTLELKAKHFLADSPSTLKRGWPRESRYQTAEVSRQFAYLAEQSSENFPDVVQTILPL